MRGSNDVPFFQLNPVYGSYPDLKQIDRDFEFEIVSCADKHQPEEQQHKISRKRKLMFTLCDPYDNTPLEHRILYYAYEKQQLLKTRFPEDLNKMKTGRLVLKKGCQFLSKCFLLNTSNCTVLPPAGVNGIEPLNRQRALRRVRESDQNSCSNFEDELEELEEGMRSQSEYSQNSKPKPKQQSPQKMQEPNNQHNKNYYTFYSPQVQPADFDIDAELDDLFRDVGN